MTAAATMNYSTAYLFSTQGISAEALSIDESKKSISNRLLDTFTMGERSRIILTRVVELTSIASVRGWDGYDGLPVTYGTHYYARRFMFRLPEHLPLPELSADPDGAISMEWYRMPDWIFSISIDDTGKLDYSGIFADKKVSGSSFFVEEIDSDIIDYIGRI
ncbi:MAG TPA: hypothetical protein PKU84_13485 [Spirochaetota bacterium]|nr:hypothetical protein [Spirochaetota bacterium]HPK57503.1 hypothetical protein [Spirochaetota bacterium]